MCAGTLVVLRAARGARFVAGASAGARRQGAARREPPRQGVSAQGATGLASGGPAPGAAGGWGRAGAGAGGGRSPRKLKMTHSGDAVRAAPRRPRAAVEVGALQAPWRAAPSGAGPRISVLLQGLARGGIGAAPAVGRALQDAPLRVTLQGAMTRCGAYTAGFSTSGWSSTRCTSSFHSFSPSSKPTSPPCTRSAPSRCRPARTPCPAGWRGRRAPWRSRSSPGRP